jgi:hypothetical protein
MFPHPSQKWSSSNQRESKWHATTPARLTMKRSASYYKPAKLHEQPDTLELPLHNCVSYTTAHSKFWTLGIMATHCARGKGGWTLPSFVTLAILQLSTRHRSTDWPTEDYKYDFNSHTSSQKRDFFLPYENRHYDEERSPKSERQTTRSLSLKAGMYEFTKGMRNYIIILRIVVRSDSHTRAYSRTQSWHIRAHKKISNELAY